LDGGHVGFLALLKLGVFSYATKDKRPQIRLK
jgi:hypothetical protein